MFCSECGVTVRGKFCSACGAPVAIAEGLPPIPDVPPVVAPQWESEVCYEKILKFPGVRDTIDRSTRQARKRMTGEQFLAVADKVVPLGVSLEGMASVIQPLYAKLGIKTGKERSHHVPAPVGQVIVRALCSLARNGQTLRNVTQAPDGCLLEATLPSDLFTLEGDLRVSVRRNGSQAEVNGVTYIGGTFFDWGKSNRCLDRLFTDLTRDAA